MTTRTREYYLAEPERWWRMAFLELVEENQAKPVLLEAGELDAFLCRVGEKWYVIEGASGAALQDNPLPPLSYVRGFHTPEEAIASANAFLRSVSHEELRQRLAYHIEMRELSPRYAFYPEDDDADRL